MVIKGNARGAPIDLAKHLQRTDTNERVSVLELRGVAALDLDGALKEMDALGAALRTDRTLYHASINVRCGEELTPAQRTRAIDRLEEALGLTGQPRAIVEHEKPARGGESRIHFHIVWSRTDLEHMRAIRCDHNFRTHELVAREMEREFGHERVQGVHIERDGPNGERVKRPDRTPSHAEHQQAQRGGIDPRQMKAEISEIWRSTDNGRAFANALEQHGYALARGDRRDFVIIDRDGGVHSLARRIEGAVAKDVRARMSDVDRDQLPDITQARATQKARQLARAERAAERTPEPEREQGPRERPAPSDTRHPPSVSPGKTIGSKRVRDGVRSPATAATTIASGILRGIGSLLGFAEGLFSPPPPPTREQVKQSQRVAAENKRLAGLREHVAELTQRQSSIVDESRARQRERDQEARDQTIREQRRRDEERSR